MVLLVLPVAVAEEDLSLWHLVMCSYYLPAEAEVEVAMALVSLVYLVKVFPEMDLEEPEIMEQVAPDLAEMELLEVEEQRVDQATPMV